LGFELPSWLAAHEERFKNAMRSGNIVANVILSILEGKLELPHGTLTNLHNLTDSSGDFIRVLRYPGTDSGAEIDPLRFPAHRDAVSIAILFTWLGGLQVVDSEAANTQNPFAVPETSWRWIKPVPGTAVVNLGDAMEVFTNKLLKSGLHRVIKAPSLQRTHDKYSVLIVARPEDSTPMRSFRSPVIPEDTEEQENAPIYSSIEWGHNKIKALQDFIDKLQSARAGKTNNIERSW
jgi:isopenicillin N synthase-like dioxygenase